MHTEIRQFKWLPSTQGRHAAHQNDPFDTIFLIKLPETEKGTCKTATEEDAKHGFLDLNKPIYFITGTIMIMKQKPAVNECNQNPRSESQLKCYLNPNLEID